VKEFPALFGPESSLVGITTQPEPAQNKTEAVACLLFNAGVIHRIGPRRLNVKLARTLAASGVTTLRFDLSGVGDSPASQQNHGLREQAVLDIKAAMDHIERTCGIRRFVLFGICSGAVQTFWAAVADERVVGLMMFDGFWYRSKRSTLIRDWKRLRAQPWRSSVAAVFRRLGRGLKAKNIAGANQLFAAGGALSSPPIQDFRRHMQALVDRGASIFFLYGGSVLEYYSYSGQFQDVFGSEAFFEKTRCELHPDIDHTVIAVETQNKLIDMVRKWVLDTVDGISEAALKPK
jgi:dienelactone hydrolase